MIRARPLPVTSCKHCGVVAALGEFSTIRRVRLSTHETRVLQPVLTLVVRNLPQQPRQRFLRLPQQRTHQHPHQQARRQLAATAFETRKAAFKQWPTTLSTRHFILMSVLSTLESVRGIALLRVHSHQRLHQVQCQPGLPQQSRRIHRPLDQLFRPLTSPLLTRLSTRQSGQQLHRPTHQAILQLLSHLQHLQSRQPLDQPISQRQHPLRAQLATAMALLIRASVTRFSRHRQTVLIRHHPSSTLLLGSVPVIVKMSH